MKNIPSKTVCDFFYVWFVVYAVLAVIALLFSLGAFGTKGLGPARFAIGIHGIITSGLAATFALFYYIICDRALLTRKE